MRQYVPAVTKLKTRLEQLNQINAVSKSEYEVLSKYLNYADVEIMLEQMKIYFRCHEETNKWKSKKMIRLYRRLEERKRVEKKRVVK